MKRGDLARALAERSRSAGTALSEGQAQDELDRLVHGIVTGLREGRPVEMPGVGIMTPQVPVDARRAAAAKPGAKKKAAMAAARKSKL